MIKNDDILQYIKENLPEELALIERSLINYYSLRNKDNKCADEEKLQETIYDGVIKLFNALSVHISEICGVDSSTINSQLLDIFIKT